MEKTEIESVRGDTLTLVVKITDADGNEIVVGEGGKVYFTMKKDFKTEAFIVQKTLDNGIIYNADKGYVVTLNTDDTNTLEYGKYVFDVEYRLNDFVKTVAIGTIKLTNEATFVGNEV